MELKLYNRSGDLKLTASTSSSSAWNQELMAENALSVSFTHTAYVPLEVNDYAVLEGIKFSVKKEYKPKQKDLQTYSYSVKLYAPIHDAEQVKYLFLTDGEYNPQFSFDGTPREHLQQWADNMNRIGGPQWSVGDVIVTSRKTIDYNNTSCWEALGKMAEAFDTEWWVDGYVINLGRCEHGRRIPLGYLKGLTSLTQTDNSDSVKFFTRLIPLGSTRNIDRSRYGFSRLQLPGREKYIDRNMQYGLYEHVEEAAFADIYPHYTGTVSAVRSVQRKGNNGKPFTIYYFKDAGMAFDPNSHELPGLKKRVSFQSGDLNGHGSEENGNYYFEADWNSAAKEWEIITLFPDETRQLPGGKLIPRVGDKYIPWNIRMPESYERQAEQDYQAAVNDFLEKYSRDVSKYSAETDYIYIEENSIPLLIGQRVSLQSDEYFNSTGGERHSRMTKIVRKLDNLNMATIECADSVGKGWKREVDSSISQLKYVLARQQENEFADILKSWDEREATDYRLMTALRVLMEIRQKSLSRLENDQASGIITFLKGLTSKEKAALLKGFEAGVFREGLTGAAINEQGDGELKSLIVRLKAVMVELEVKGQAKTGSLKTGIADISEKTTTLNLLVKALAEIHNLTVDDTARMLRGIIRESLSSPEFVSGFAGNGFRIYKDAVTGDWNAEVDNLVVRKLFNVFEIRVQRITHQGGMVIRSAAGGKITKVTNAGTSWRCEHDGLDDFVTGDQVLCQAFKFIGQGGKIKRYWRLATEAGKGYVCLSGSDCEAGSATPEVGDEIVVLGNRTNRSRQSAQIDCVIGADAPYRDTYDGINSYSLAGKLITREGNLSGIVDADFGSLDGYGLYTKNLNATGRIRLTNGKTVERYVEDLADSAKSEAVSAAAKEITKVRTDFDVREGQISAKVREVTEKTSRAESAAQRAASSASEASGKATEAGDILREVTTKETAINQTAGQISLEARKVVENSNAAKESAGAARNAAELATATGKGRMLYKDPTFVKGMNGITKYGNDFKDRIAVERVPTGEGNPSTSTHMLKITATGFVAPGYGGFTFQAQSKANRVLITRITAKIPVGKIIDFATNAIGRTGAKREWLTSQEGTGEWTEYVHRTICGKDGAFSSTCYFWIDKGTDKTAPTAENPLVWYVSSATVYDVTDAEIPYLSEAEAEGKYTAKTVYEAKMRILDNALSTKVGRADFNALGERVGTAETNIRQQADSIRAQAEKYDSLNDRLRSAEVKITPDAIKSTVKSQTDTLIADALPTTKKSVDLRDLDENKYYPVTMKLKANNTRMAISVKTLLYSGYGKPGWTAHSQGSFAETVWETAAEGWGGWRSERVIKSFSQGYVKAGIVTMGSIGQNTMNNEEYIYVRGGKAYDIEVTGMKDVVITLHKADYLWEYSPGSQYRYNLPVRDSVTAPSVTYTTKREFQSSIEQLDNRINLKVSQTDFNNLGQRVGMTESSITQLPRTIDARITTGVNDGGVIKEKVESWFRMEGNKMFLGAKSIDMSGAVIFRSLATKDEMNAENKKMLDKVSATEGLLDELKKGTLERFPNLKNIMSAFNNGNTAISGGLILSNTIVLGDENGRPTAVISGGTGDVLRAGITKQGDVEKTKVAISHDGRVKLGDMHLIDEEGVDNDRIEFTEEKDGDTHTYLQIGGRTKTEADMLSSSTEMKTYAIQSAFLDKVGTTVIDTTKVRENNQSISYRASLSVNAHAFGGLLEGDTDPGDSSTVDCRVYLRAIVCNIDGSIKNEVRSSVAEISLNDKPHRRGESPEEGGSRHAEADKMVNISIPASNVSRGDTVLLVFVVDGSIRPGGGEYADASLYARVSDASKTMPLDKKKSLVTIAKDKMSLFFGRQKYILFNYFNDWVVKIVGGVRIDGILEARSIKTSGLLLAGEVTKDGGCQYKSGYYKDKEVRTTRNGGFITVWHNIGVDDYALILTTGGNRDTATYTNKNRNSFTYICRFSDGNPNDYSINDVSFAIFGTPSGL